MMGNKGSVLDLFFVMVSIFVVGITILVGRFLWTEISPELTSHFTSTTATSVVTTVTSGFAIMDYVFMFMAVGSGVGIIILAYVVDFHPIFIFFTIILLVFAILVAPSLSNVFDEIGSTSELSDTLALYPMMDTFMSNYPLFIMVIGFLLMIVMYGKAGGVSR